MGVLSLDFAQAQPRIPVLPGFFFNFLATPDDRFVPPLRATARVFVLCGEEPLSGTSPGPTPRPREARQPQRSEDTS